MWWQDQKSKFRGSSVWLNNYRSSMLHRTGMEFLGLGKGQALMDRLIAGGFAFTSAYLGYQREGIKGAIKDVATNYAFGVAWGALKATGAGSLLYGALGVGIGLGYSYRKELLRPIVRENIMKHNKLEMGRPIIDQFGTLATMRQRSVMAIQNSKINGRSALGNEALIFSSHNYWR